MPFVRRSSNVSEERSRRSVEQCCLTLGELYKASERASRAPVSYTRRFVAQESTRSTFWRERSARTVAEAGTALAVPGHRAQSPLTASCRVRSRDMTERERPSQVRERLPKRRDRPRDGRQRLATWQHSHSCSTATAAAQPQSLSRPSRGRQLADPPRLVRSPCLPCPRSSLATAVSLSFSFSLLHQLLTNMAPGARRWTAATRHVAHLLHMAVTPLRDVVKPVPGQDAASGQVEEQLLAIRFAAVAVELWQRPVIEFLPSLTGKQWRPAHRNCFDLELQLIVWQSEDIQFNTHMTAVDKLQRFALLLVCSSVTAMSHTKLLGLHKVGAGL